MGTPVYLVLENGEYWQGESFGAADQDVTGEVVFTTGMTGYLETLTDPSYCGQMVVQTFPLIGNYGIIPSDFESNGVHPAAYIVREWCQHPSNFRCEGDIDAFLKAQNIPGIVGIDTRMLTKRIREQGVMNGLLTTKAPPYDQDTLQRIRSYRLQGTVEQVTRREAQTYPVEQERYRVVLWDFGAKQNIVRELNKRGCTVTAVPAHTTAADILALNPDGIMLSNGPGDPADNEDIIRELHTLCQAAIPTFGICLGHQLLALANGAKTGKLKYGHRGANQPVKELETGRVYITSQNHGYAVLSDTLPDGAIEAFINVNDQTCEGVRYTNMPAFSVQFHPEASAGPLDTAGLFDDFIALMENGKEEPQCR